jgi:catechol 2,3-dioxygenase-like lactoylglutathione lyase family enzyme
LTTNPGDTKRFVRRTSDHHEGDSFADLTAAGGQPVWPPAAAVQPGARFAYVMDPEGNLLELIQPPPEKP